MQFLAPAGLFFLLLIPVIIIFYLLKQKREQLPVSSTMLWQKVLADTVAETPWQKLRKSLLLLLQLLLALLLVFALLRPYVLANRQGGSDVIILVDTSASMAVSEAGGSRLDLAKAEVEKLIKESKGKTRFSLIGVGPSPRVLANRTTDVKEVLNKLKTLQTGYYRANLETALSLAAALQEKGTATQVLFFSDGGVDTPEGAVGLEHFEYRRVGERQDNLAIGAFSMQEGSGQPLALTRIDNYGSKEGEGTVRLLGDGRLLDAQPVRVSPGKPAYLFWNVPQGASYLEARLDATDALASDNSAWLISRQARQAKVLLVTQGNIFLEQALKLNPMLDVHKVATGAYGEVKERFDLYVLDGFWPGQQPSGQLLVINPPSDSPFVEKAEGMVEKLDPAPDQPLLRGVSWADVHVAKSKGLKMPAGWQSLLRDGSRTLAAAGTLGQVRAGVLGFDLHMSDLPLRPAFPILMQNLVSWILPPGGLRDTQAESGGTVGLNISPDAQAANLYNPDQNRTALAPSQQKLEVGEPGLYRLEQVINGQKREDYLAVNFAPVQESQVKPAAQVKLGLKDVAAGAPAKVPQEFWPWLALAALAVMSVEWWVYLRGH